MQVACDVNRMQHPVKLVRANLCICITFAFLNIALPDGPKNPDRPVQFYW